MLNYIIPPIVIILSLAALVIFIFRRSARISKELALEKNQENSDINGPGKQKLFRFTQFFLRVSEKGMQYFKLLSLKFYNKTDNWFRSIKEKRLKIRKEKLPAPEENKFQEIQQEIKISERQEKIASQAVSRGRDEDKESNIEPMISKKVTRPDSSGGVKNEFERALIERIAFNPRDIEAYERLGDYYIEVGNFKDSFSCFEEVLILSPTNRKAKIKVKRLQKIVFDKLGR